MNGLKGTKKITVSTFVLKHKSERARWIIIEYTETEKNTSAKFIGPSQ